MERTDKTTWAQILCSAVVRGVCVIVAAVILAGAVERAAAGVEGEIHKITFTANYGGPLIANSMFEGAPGQTASIYMNGTGASMNAPTCGDTYTWDGEATHVPCEPRTRP